MQGGRHRSEPQQLDVKAFNVVLYIREGIQSLVALHGQTYGERQVRSVSSHQSPGI